MVTVFLTALMAVSVIVKAQSDLSVKFLESDVQVALQARQRITCELNRTLLDLVNDIDVEIVRKSIDNTTETIMSRGARKVEAESGYYSVMISENPGFGVRIKFEFLNVRILDEGRYVCRVKPNNDDTVLLAEDSINIAVLKPVENICLKFGQYNCISSSNTDSVEVDAGNYLVVCTAEGSNPAATLHLYLDGKAVGEEATRMNKMESHLIKFRTEVTGHVPLTLSNSRGTVECVSQDHVGNKRSVKFPFKTKLYDPEIYCNDTEAYPGQKHPVLTCTVDYSGLKIKSFRYETSGKRNAVFKELSHEPLSDTTVRVRLQLDMAEDWHFETEFYMVVEHQDGHVTRQSVMLHKIPGDEKTRDSGGDSFIRSGPTMMVFFACIIWLL